MDRNILKSYDIASFDIELEYNKKIAPINRKIDRLNVNHETKSLSAHKDFLTKEKKSKEKLNELSDKAVIKEQKIIRAAENKIIKLNAKENRIRTTYDTFVEEKNLLANEEYAKIDAVTATLKVDEKQNVEEIKQKYKTNIESYVEKLNIYNDNFEKNKQFHIQEIKKYQDIVNNQLDALRAFHTTATIDLDNRLQAYTKDKEHYDTEVVSTTSDATRNLSNFATNIRKRANIVLHDTKEYIEELKLHYENHLEPEIEFLRIEIKELKQQFEERRDLIQDDLELNLKKLEQQLEELTGKRTRKAAKNINMKMNLFNIRATTAIQYEERLMKEKLIVLENEKRILEEQLRYELLNIDKLNVFMQNDQIEIKETGDYFKELNITLKNELNNFELSNNNYVLKHEQLKTDFIHNYTKIFSDLKESTILLSQAYLEKIADNNFEIDEINKFLDTAEPLKEIEVNKLREDIEISEVTERFNIKYAKQQYETDLVKNDLETDVAIREQQMKEELSENNLEIQNIKIKEEYDKALEKAKLKHSKAQEVFNLRLNNTKLERNLLKNKYETEIAISIHDKSLIEIDVRKHNALISKEIEYTISNLEKEANYKIEVINKGLEEDLLKLEEQVSKVNYEKDAYSINLNREIEEKNREITNQKDKIEHAALEKSNMIEQALAREIKEPSRNILKTETIIDERLSKLDINNGIFVDFINDSIEGYKDNRLTLEQIREVIINNDSLRDKSEKYINRTYQVLREAHKFMSDIELHAVLNHIAASSDQTIIKKHQKHQTKIESEFEKQTNDIITSEQDHIAVISAHIAEELQQIKRSNYDTLEELVTNTEHAYNRIFDKLQNLQNTIKQESAELYNTLTKRDQELISHAESNAEIAKQKVQEEKLAEFAPLEQDLNKFLNDKDEKRSEFNAIFDEQLNQLRTEINRNKNVALEKVKDINQDKNTLIQEQSEKKRMIEETEEKEIVKQYEKVDEGLKRLEAIYNNTLTKLNEKDQEAKKIFDYEDRIYNIAVESATSRFNDATIKAKNRHLSNVSKYRNDSETATKNKERNMDRLNKDLLQLTNSFEKNIFTVRPRLEESIGDAQKAIDKEVNEKELKLTELTDNTNKLILATENTLYTSFQEGYDRLSNNLSNYVEKYRMIEQEYVAKNNQSNSFLNENNLTFSKALFELSKNKHEKVIKELKQINIKMMSEEDPNA